MNDEFAYLATRKDLPKELTPTEMKQELAIMRAFFDRWESMHKLINEKASKKDQEIASLMLVDAANAVRALKTPVILNG